MRNSFLRACIKERLCIWNGELARVNGIMDKCEHLRQEWKNVDPVGRGRAECEVGFGALSGSGLQKEFIRTL